MTFLKYKANEEKLKALFAEINVEVRIESINSADIYYTDGDASNSLCKLIFTGGPTVYLPQLIYNVKPEYIQLIEKWIAGLNGDVIV